jgi:hypothetical protein
VIDLINLHWWCLVLFICLSSGLFTMWFYGFFIPLPYKTHPFTRRFFVSLFALGFFLM